MAYSSVKKTIKIFLGLLIGLVFGLLIFLGFFYFFNNETGPVKLANSSFRDKIFESSEAKDYSKVFLKIAEKTIETELVFSQEAMYLGLSWRENLLLDKGMLFVFKDYGQRSFSMRNMNFPLDIIFLKDGMVMKVFSNLAPEGVSPKNIYQYGPADMVIELPANYFKNNNLKEGMVFEFIGSEI
ncbi:DUF192 domain-containing protein [Candidatus Falkowbacteria bacterium]|nr:DUF192 domain-containing protein [Candidatus Falkowbacteria bacterium]NCT55144.1 DUF192 domain-containing protein [Candidatus Falkowbacteria bacterium]